MAVIEGTVGRRSLLELGTGGRRKEEVFLILRAQNRGKTSDRSPLGACTGFAKSWEMVVCVMYGVVQSTGEKCLQLMRLERSNCGLSSCAGDFTVWGICEI